MRLKNKRIGILVENFYQDLEVWYPFYRLKEEGAEVRLIGPVKGMEYRGKYGYPAVADRDARRLSVNDFDAVVIPGGFAPDYLRRNVSLVKFVRQMFQAGKVVAAICHGGWLLVSAGVLPGRRVTSFFAIRDDLKNAGAHWFDREVIRDGNLITSRQPEDLPAFVKTIIEALS